MAARTDGLPDLLTKRRQFTIEDDFNRDVDSADWVTTLTDTGTASVGDAVGGILAIVPSDGTVADNDEAYVESANEVFKFTANKPLLFEARIQFTEANTDDANILVGVMDAVGANSLVDNGGGPPSSYSGANLHKVDGGTVWIAETSNSTTQITTELSAANLNNLAKRAVTAGGAAYQTLKIEYMPYSSTNAYVSFFVDGVLVAMQWGAEIGLAPMQALQNIAVINGKPSVYGDAAMALVQASPHCEDIEEYFENENTPNPTAVCVAKRRGRKPVVAKFSVEDAKRAGLWGKQGPWQAYPKRMDAQMYETMPYPAGPDLSNWIKAFEDVLVRLPSGHVQNLYRPGDKVIIRIGQQQIIARGLLNPNLPQRMPVVVESRLCTKILDFLWHLLGQWPHCLLKLSAWPIVNDCKSPVVCALIYPRLDKHPHFIGALIGHREYINQTMPSHILVDSL